MNKTAVITGASRGIGRAAAYKFACAGYNVVLNSKNGKDNLDSAYDLCRSVSREGAGMISIPGDISDPGFAKMLIDKAADTFGSVDILVNNAGISFVGLIQDTTDDIWQNVINTNLSSVHYCTRAVIPHMLKNACGHIINISSVWGNVGASCEAAYSASKGGVNAYTKACAKELAPSGISVNAIACGMIDTDMNAIFSREEKEDIISGIPADRMGQPKEVAGLALQICTGNEYLTGQIITLDGGWI